VLEAMSVPAIIAMVNALKKLNPPTWLLPFVAVLFGVATQWLDPDPVRIWQDRVAKGGGGGRARRGPPTAVPSAVTSRCSAKSCPSG